MKSEFEHSTSPTLCGSGRGADNTDLDAVIAAVSEQTADADEAQDEDDHPTWIDIEFPQEVHMLHGLSSVSLPIRQILTWMAAHDPDYRERLLAIRDDFYDEDHDDGFMIGDQHQIYDREELARLRIDRRQKKSKREEDRKNAVPSDTIIVSTSSSPEERWGSYAAEELALEAELSDHWSQSDELDRKWEEFVEKIRLEPPRSWIEMRRSELRLEGASLDHQLNVLMVRLEELNNRAHSAPE